MECMLALDPGLTTGYCFATHRDRRLYLIPGQYKFSLWELDSLLLSLPNQPWTHIIYEDFQYRNRARAGLDLTPVKMIGIIEYRECMPNSRIGFHKQSAAEGKGFYTDAKLKELGVYVKGLKHGNDATRHLLHWINFKAGSRIIDPKETIMELDLQKWTLESDFRDFDIKLP